MADDVFQRGARMIERVRLDRLSHAVVYVPKCGGAVEGYATASWVPEETAMEGEVGDVRRLRDYLISATALSRRPEVGDLIRETVDGETVTYEVTTIGPDPCWSYDDTLNKRLRVHTRRKTA
jgi:hypothetical protein